MTHILIVDNHGMVPPEMDEPMRRLGNSVVRFSSIAAALDQASAQTVDIVFIDGKLLGEHLAAVLHKLRDVPSHPEVIVVTHPGNPEEAEQAIKNGAWDYISTATSANAFALILSRVAQYRQHRAPRTNRRAIPFEGIVGQTPQMSACLELASQAADSDANVLIIGETGTGKELLAAAIHNNSRRARKNFVVVDCAAIPESLVESTLLGYEKGAFTGADKAHAGLVKQADGGTLFLDEVSELPLTTQKSFLRVLQERRFRPVGGSTEEQSNFRIIAASNRNLSEMVERGEFRKDLLFRIRGFTIEPPPLRERQEDIEPTIRHYLPLLCKRLDVDTKQLSGDFVKTATSYPWPGNVRELINALERSIVAARAEPTLFPTHLPTYIRAQLARASVTGKTIPAEASFDSSDSAPSLPLLKDVREAAVASAEKKYLSQAITIAKGDIAILLQITGLSRSRLYALLKKHSINPYSQI